MSRVYTLSDDQLEFISFLRNNSVQLTDLEKRIGKQMSQLSEAENVYMPNSNSGKELHHSPKKMIEFLSLFSRDDRFKWYTHKWDQQGVTLENMIDTQKSIIRLLEDMVYKSQCPVNENTLNQVKNFINFGITPDSNFFWTDNRGIRYKIGWHSIVELSKKSPDTTIEDLILPDGHSFKDYIRMFKSVIEFRTDLSEKDRFSEFVRAAIRKFVNGALSIKYDEKFDDIGYDISVYCDVAGVYFAIQTICAWMVKHKEYGHKVMVTLNSLSDCYELVIFQEGSFFTNLKKLESPTGDFATLINRLFSVCDFKMLGDYKLNREYKGSVIVNVLDDSSVRKGLRMVSPCKIEYNQNVVGGVKYILKIYK